MDLASTEWRELIEYCIPVGWWKAFGEQLCDDLQKTLSHLPSGAIKDFRIVQVKEKYGGLRIYTNWQTKEISSLIRKYEDLSYKICVECGAPATKMSTGWICPYCDEHAPEGSIPINDYLTDSIKEV